MAQQSAVADVAARAQSYGMPGVIVDGNDVLDVYGAVKGAVDRARAGAGPSLVECKTYRLMPHTSDDDDRRYRTAEEVAAWREKDPVLRLRRYLLDGGLQTAEALDAVDAEVVAEVADVTRRADEAAPPVAEAAYGRVYARPIRPTPGVPAAVDEAPAQPPAAPPRPATASSAPSSTRSARRCTT